MHYDFDDFCKLITLADWEFEFEMNFSKLGDFYQWSMLVMYEVDKNLKICFN